MVLCAKAMVLPVLSVLFGTVLLASHFQADAPQDLTGSMEHAQLQIVSALLALTSTVKPASPSRLVLAAKSGAKTFSNVSAPTALSLTV